MSLPSVGGEAVKKKPMSLAKHYRIEKLREATTDVRRMYDKREPHAIAEVYVPKKKVHGKKKMFGDLFRSNSRKSESALAGGKGTGEGITKSSVNDDASDYDPSIFHRADISLSEKDRVLCRKLLRTTPRAPASTRYSRYPEIHGFILQMDRVQRREMNERIIER